MHPVSDAIIAILLVIGAAFALVGSYGLAKLGDFAKRLHGPTKATTLGVGSVLAASAVFFSQNGLSLHELLIAAFLFITAPVSAQLLIKTAIATDPSLKVPARPASGDAEPTDGKPVMTP